PERDPGDGRVFLTGTRPGGQAEDQVVLLAGPLLDGEADEGWLDVRDQDPFGVLEGRADRRPDLGGVVEADVLALGVGPAHRLQRVEGGLLGEQTGIDVPADEPETMRGSDAK